MTELHSAFEKGTVSSAARSRRAAAFPPHHYLIAQLLALKGPHPKRPWQRQRPGTAPLFTPTQVALLIGMHPQSVQALLRKPGFRALLAREQDEAGKHSPGLSADELWALRQRAVLHDCLDRIQHRLLDDPDLSLDEIRKVTMGLIKSAGLAREASASLWGRPVSPEARLEARAILRAR